MNTNFCITALYRRVRRERSALKYFVAICALCFIVRQLLVSHHESTQHTPQQKSPPAKKYAFAAFLDAPQTVTENDNDDVYFVGTRMLGYQFLHDPHTRTQEGHDFIVLVTEDVHERKKARLAKDGASVIEVSKISSDWIKSKVGRWRDVLAKLHLFELTEYELVAFFDSDMFIARNMDGIFRDKGVQVMPHLNETSRAKFDDGPEPSTYAFAATTGQGHYDHPYPQRKGKSLNSGCVVFKPSKELFDLYVRITQSGEGRFDPRFPEQNLWNYVHRHTGNMPWQYLEGDWNTNWPTIKDYQNGFASLHAKFWDCEHDHALRDLLLKSRWKMEGFYEAVDDSGRNPPQGL